MKNYLQLFLFLLLLNATAYAQDGVSIGATTAHGSAMLDITSTNKGLLIPRMTTAQRMNIGSTPPFAVPTQGLMVFDTDLDCIMNYTLASGWKALVQSGSPKAVAFKVSGGTFPSYDTFNKVFMAVNAGVGYNYGGTVSLIDGRSVFTAPTSGVYHFEVNLKFFTDLKTTTKYQIRFRKHSSIDENSYSYGTLHFDGTFDIQEAVAVKDYVLNIGDTIDVEYLIKAPSPTPGVFNIVNTISTFSGFRISAF
ncbi:MAG: hypothetical protein EAZ15_05620 [Sphingobacteriales bacterium]|nr:MAG: hypothetical protein EAZ15_05620 [Sphingobacteriales bacterium]